MIELSLRNIAKSFGAFQVLDNITFELHTKERVGLIGGNGTGKTTIFKIITQDELPDDGEMSFRKGLQIGCLQQIPDFPDGYTVERVLKGAFNEEYEMASQLAHLEQQMTQPDQTQAAKAIKEYGQLQQRFEQRGGYEIESEINKICTGLKITDSIRQRRFDVLSGGEQTTVMLAQLLLTKPDLLLLDEPSNHLDVDSLEWLEGFLREYTGTVCVISHDRYFLDQVVTRIIEVEDGECSEFHGNYSYYVQEKERRLLAEFAQYQEQQKKIAAMEKAIRDMKDWGNRSDNPKFHKRAASMQKRLDKMEKLERTALEKTKIQLDFSEAKRSGTEVFVAKDLHFSFGSEQILSNASWSIRYGERVALVGRNGSGKSTLLKLLLGEYQPAKGSIKQGARVKMEYCPQQVTFVDETMTVLEAFRDSHPCTQGQARNILATFMFYGEDVFKKVSDLSGGERSRLRLCQLIQENINTLVLDEPTNHLDIDSIEMLEEALLEFTGTIIFVSHDRYFINKIADKVVELDSYGLHQYLGNYDYYREKKTQLVAIPKTESKHPKPSEKPKVKKTMAPSALPDVEEQIRQLEEAIQQQQTEAAAWGTNLDKLTEIHQKTAELQEQLDILLAEWVELAEQT